MGGSLSGMVLLSCSWKVRLGLSHAARWKLEASKTKCFGFAPRRREWQSSSACTGDRGINKVQEPRGLRCELSSNSWVRPIQGSCKPTKEDIMRVQRGLLIFGTLLLLNCPNISI